MELPHRSGCNDLSKHLVQEMSQCEFSPTPEIPASKDDFPNLALDARNHLRIGLGIAQRVRHSSLNDLIGLRLWSYLCSEDDLKTDPSVVANHEQLEKLVHDKQVVLAARRANKVMDKTAMRGAKLDGMCGVLEKNEQAEDEASQTLGFLSHQEWLDADLDSSQKLTVRHCEVLIKHGLQKHKVRSCLTCAHHDTQLWSANEVWKHFMVYKHGPERNEILSEIDNPLDPIDREEQQVESVMSQWQADRDGVAVRDLVEHILTLAVAAFHESGESAPNATREARIERERIELCDFVSSSFVSCEIFSEVLKAAVKKTKNEHHWNDGFEAAHKAMSGRDWTGMRTAVGKLFQTLQVTVNNYDDMSLELAAIICSRIMTTVVHKDLGSMSFTMVLDAENKFTSKMRYKPQGTGIHKRQDYNLFKTAKRRSRKDTLFISFVDPC